MALGAFPLPPGHTFQTWGLALAQMYPNIIVPYPPPTKYWRGWACYLLTLAPFISLPVPDKRVYKGDEGWVEWAFITISILQS